MLRIKQLSTTLANQIAAGEVIERPASVVKELLENSLDAGARSIEIIIEKGGTRLIKVIDDGQGIHPDDLALAITSHATSKIFKLEDLFEVGSLGFRGEALASICSVSHTEIISKIASSDNAFKISASGASIFTQCEPAAHPTGTTILVRDLFFNTPVRRKFLYSEQTEFGHVETLVRRIALSHFDVAFKLIHNEKIIFQSMASVTKEARIKKIFNSSFLSNAKMLDVMHDGCHLWGWLALPSFMRSQNDLQYCYLNKRMVRDKLINHALRQAYQDKLYPGRQAAYLLYLELSPKEVDVNVHPTKYEVRFKQPRQIHDFIVSEVTRAVSNSVDGKSRIAEPQKSYAAISETVTAASPAIVAWLPPHYWLVDYKAQHLLCNYQCLYQDWCSELLQQSLENKAIKSRPSLVPILLPLSAADVTVLSHYFESLEALGLQLSQLDQQTIAIRQFPTLTPYLDFKSLIQDLIKQASVASHSLNSLLLLIVQHNLIPKNMSAAEMNTLLNHLQRLVIKPHRSYKIVSAAAWEQFFNMSS